MLTLFNQMFGLPKFEDPNQERVAQILNLSMWIVFVAALILPFIFLFSADEINLAEQALNVFGPTVILVISTFVIRWLLFSGRLQTAGVLLSLMFLIAVTLAIYNSGLGIESPSISGYVVVIILSGLLSEGRTTVLVFTIVSLLATFGFYLIQQFELLVPSEPLPLGLTWIVYIFVFTLTGVLLSAALRRLNLALERAQTSEQSLREFADVLEDRVAERTKALEIGAEINRRLSIILNQEQLVTEVVDEVQKAFGYYHVHIYLLDEHKQNLILASGSGEVGKILLANGHRLPITKGLIGQAVRESRTIMALNVLEHRLWEPNTLLSETASELAVPIMLGQEVKGVLDVQHDVQYRLNENDKIWLELIAGQVAVALENARLFREAERKGVRESLVNEIGQKIQRAHSVDAVLRIATQELGQALNSHRTRVQIGHIES